VAGKPRAAKRVGFNSELNDLGADATSEQLLAAIDAWNHDSDITAFMVQTPLPRDVNPLEMFAAVDPLKDSDGLSPTNLGLLFSGRTRVAPATPAGVMTMLDAYKIPLSGQVATVVGKSVLVGRTVAALLAQRGVTVISCDSKTPDLGAQTRQADIVIAATGRPGLITADMVKEGAIVIDVGITKQGESLVGDVDFEAVSKKASAITPVPGGVGPMTVVSLLENVYALSQLAVND
jgi:methylenetetrahydrofolate dehydrogenase (NADP+)/methenyltetrahydrofolate cyclohydrolase